MKGSPVRVRASAFRVMMGAAQRMPSRSNTPMSTGLSQALIAYVIELDNEFEQRFARAGGGARVVSVAMWSNLLRFVGDGITVGEFPAAVGAAEVARALHARRHGAVALRHARYGRRGSASGDVKRDGYGSARGMKGSWIVRPTPAGRSSRGDLEDALRRHRCAVERALRSRRDRGARELTARDRRSRRDLPDALPILGGANGMRVELPAASRDPIAADAHLFALLSRDRCWRTRSTSSATRRCRSR